MALITRRLFLQGAAGFGLGAAGLGGYAMGIEPGLLLNVTSYVVRPASWPPGLKLKIAVVADIHACEPWMSAARVRQIAEATNALKPDLIALLGDFAGGHNYVTAPVMPDAWGEALSILKAPLGVHAVLGNHDWWHGALPRLRGDNGETVRRTLRAAGFAVMENDALRLEKDGKAFWLLGLGDQMAFRTSRTQTAGIDDLDGTLRLVTDAAPAILMAHEPYIFRRVPGRVALTLCGHTHGGQVNLPFVANAMSRRRHGVDFSNYGLTAAAGGQSMIISGGLGTSILPVRFLRPPEIVEVDIEAATV